MTSGIPVPPAQRPVKYRRGSRIIVMADDRVLLMRDSDPGVPGMQWWVTPGGGLDPGESWRAAAARELFEETGHRVHAADLQGPVAKRIARHGYSDRVLVQHEMFFVLRVAAPFEVSTAGFTAAERRRLTGWQWFQTSELTELEVWPQWLTEILDASPERCRDFGTQDESTVPILPGQAEQLPDEFLAQ